MQMAIARSVDLEEGRRSLKPPPLDSSLLTSSDCLHQSEQGRKGDSSSSSSRGQQEARTSGKEKSVKQDLTLKHYCDRGEDGVGQIWTGFNPGAADRRCTQQED